MPASLLPFSRLKEGNKVLAVVKKVNDFELVLALPNHHTAFVSCNRVSGHLEKLFTSFTRENEDEQEESAGDEESKLEAPPMLSEFFKVGDSVIGSIVALEGAVAKNAEPVADQKNKKRKRIEVSLVPSQVNSDLTAEELMTEGVILPGEIASTEDKGYVVDFGVKNSKGFLSFDRVNDAKFIIGQVLLCRVAKTSNKASAVVPVELFDGSKAAGSKINSFTALRPGTIVEQIKVTAIEEGFLTVSVNGLPAQIDAMNLPIPSTLTPPGKAKAENALGIHFPIGSIIERARVVFYDDGSSRAGEKSLLISALPSVLVSDKVRREIEGTPNENLAIGNKFDEAKIVRVDPALGVIVELIEEGESVGFAQVHISRMSDEKLTKIVAPYKAGSIHPARIVDYDIFSALPIASMAPSVLNQPFLNIQSIEVGSVVRGEVTTVNPSLGLLVNLTDRIRALCPLNHLTETQSSDAIKSYRIGQKFKFRVLDCDAASRKVTLTRKKGMLDSDLPPLLDLSSALPGMWFDGYVAAIRPFGCIVRFYNNIKALLPIAELSDDFTEKPQDVVFEGQVVRVRVVKLDQEKNEFVVSLRKSDEKPKKEKRKLDKKTEVKEAKVEKPVVVAVEGVSEENVTKKAKKEEVVQKSVESVKVQKPVESVKVETPIVEVSKVKMPSMRELEEEETVKEEQMLGADDSESNLNSANSAKIEDSFNGLSVKDICEEFERRLLGSPNSSFLWIQYMSVLLKASEIETARSIANRALQTISIRMDTEKLNVWIALMNLEHTFGTKDQLKAVFERACVYNDSKKVHLALAKIYEEAAAAGPNEEAFKAVEDFYTNQIMKKFRQSCKVWLGLAQFLFVVKKATGQARKVLQQALEALPKRKHVKVTLKFAQMEFRYGSADRGRTLFEGILAGSPSRLDIWSVYIAQEERCLPESLETVRRLHERILSLKLSSKKAKFFFKKYLDLEKKWGDQVSIQHVKELAQKFVESTLNK